MILLLESLHAEAEKHLAQVAPLLRAAEPNAPPEDLAEVRAIVTRGRGRIPEELMARCPALRVVARAGAGLDNIDTVAAARRGIAVVFAPGANTDTVAEHTLALMLDLSRGITRSARAVRQGRWEERAHYRGEELAERTLGIVGFGNIGRRVARLAEAFGMRVLVAEHTQRPGVHSETEGGPERVALHSLLAMSDIVTLHLPATSATRGLIGAAELACMQPGALLINTARGALVDTHALREALQAGRIGGFAADVLDGEPPGADDPLLSRDDVVVTPHVASLTSATYRRLCLSTAENVARFLRDEPVEPRALFSHRA